MRLADRQPGERIRAGRRCDRLQPVIHGPLTHPAQHGVDEPGCSGPVDLAGQRHCLGDRRMGGHPHTQQLMAAQAQRVEDVRVDRRAGPSGGHLDDGVVASPQAQRPVAEFGGEGSIAPAESGGAQHRWQLEVRIGPLGDGP